MIEHQRTIVCFCMLPIENLIQSYQYVTHLSISNCHLIELVTLDVSQYTFVGNAYPITFLMILYLKTHKCN